MHVLINKDTMEHLTDDELLDWIDGYTPLADTLLYKTHLVSCAFCEARYQQMMYIHESLADLPLEQPSALFTQQVMTQLMPQMAKKTHISRKPLFVFLGIMGGLLLFTILLMVGLPSVTAFSPVSLALEDVTGTALNWTGKISTQVTQPIGLYVLVIVNALLVLTLINQRLLYPYFVRYWAWKG